MASDSLSQSQQGLPSLLNSLNRALECALCLEDNKDLRTLTCCEKLVCLSCLEKWFDDATSRGKDAPDCPLCTRTLTKKPEEYKVSKVVQHFQAYAQSLSRAVMQETDEKCETPGCRRPFDKRCKKCKMFLCYRCSLELCSFDDADHDAMDIRDCITQSREEFCVWKTAKEKTIQNYKQQVEEKTALIRDYGQQLTAVSESFVEKTGEILPLLTATHESLVELNDAKKREESELNVMVSVERNCRFIELVRVTEQLQIYEKRREVVIGDPETIVNGIMCFDLMADCSGNILIAKLGGLDVMDAEGKRLLKSLEFQLYVFTIEIYKEVILCGVRVSTELKEIATLDRNYQRINHWTIPLGVRDFSAVDDKIFLASENEVCANIRVYSLSGQPLSQFDLPWNGCVGCIDSVAPCSLVLSDCKENKVYKKCVTSGKRQTDWSAEVRAPDCLYVDSTGLTWIRSNDIDCFTILNRDGSRHQEDIMDEKFSRFGEVNDLLVHNDFLYIAHDEGVTRFAITHR